jgi:hypothetical protein
MRHASVSGGHRLSIRYRKIAASMEELACYPTRDLGRRRINHTRFRGTEFCAADQFFTKSIMVIFWNDYKCVADYPGLFVRKTVDSRGA